VAVGVLQTFSEEFYACVLRVEVIRDKMLV
jgi:hypothetical protein